MTDLGDPQDRAESLDTEVVSDDYDDPSGSLQYPPDRPAGVSGYGTTPAEERVPEPLDEWVRRESPDMFGSVDEPSDEELAAIEAEQLERELADAEATSGLDETMLDDLDGSDDLDAAVPVGRLVEPPDDEGDWDEDIEPDAVASVADEEEIDLSAEEDAVHLTSDPPFGELGDGYIRSPDYDVDFVDLADDTYDEDDEDGFDEEDDFDDEEDEEEDELDYGLDADLEDDAD